MKTKDKINWIAHVPGVDKMPPVKGKMVQVRLRGGNTSRGRGETYFWGALPSSPSYEIVMWAPANRSSLTKPPVANKAKTKAKTCKMTTQGKVAWIKKIVAAHQKADKLQDLAHDAGTVPYEGKFSEALNHYAEVAIDAFAAAIGDKDAWINWFIFDNGCGKDGREVKVPRKGQKPVFVPIFTVEALVKVMNKRGVRR